MKKVKVEYITRTKLLDTAVASIQNRMNSFKKDYETLTKDDFETNHNLAGRTWVRLPNDNEDLVFNAGKYNVEEKVSANGKIEFHVHFSAIMNKIKSIYVVTGEE